MKIATIDWIENTERDLAGYRIRRNGKWLADVPKGKSSYVDATVPDDAISATYTVAAFDRNDLEGEPSDAVTKFYDVSKLSQFSIEEKQDQVVVTWDPTVYPKVTAPRKTTKSLVTITISKG